MAIPSIIIVSQMVLLTNPILLIPLCLGLLFLLAFLFIKRFSAIGNLFGVAGLVAYAILEMVFGVSYIELIVTLLIALAVYLVCFGIRGRLRK